MIDKSDDYIQVDVDRCVKKEKLNLDEYKLEQIKKELNYHINSFGPIKTSEYRNFSRFPILNYEWNKYLLVGIIRGYFDDLFEIEYTDNMSTKTDYIIRRKI